MANVDINQLVTMGTLQEYTDELEKRVTFNTNNLYLHSINLRGGHYTTKLTVEIIDDNAFDLTITEIQNYIKRYFTIGTKELFRGNGDGLRCTGFAANNVESQIKYVFSLAYITEESKFAVLQEVDGSLPICYVLPGLTLNSQKTILLALNNTDKGSVKTFTSAVTEGSTSRGTMNWTCVKTPVSETQFRYSWSGYFKSAAYSESAWGTWGSLFLSPKYRIDLPDAKMIGKCVYNASLNSQTCMSAYSQGTGQTCEFYLIRGTQVSTNAITLEIVVYCDYVST